MQIKLDKRNKERLRIILAIAIIFVGITHFVVPTPYAKITPLPNPEFWVYLSGFYEILGGIGLLIPPTSQAAAWGLLLLFIAVYPANINMAVNRIHILEGIPDTSPIFQGIRLPLQAVFIAWAYWYTKATTGDRQASIVPYSLLRKLFPNEPGAEVWMQDAKDDVDEKGDR